MKTNQSLTEMLDKVIEGITREEKEKILHLRAKEACCVLELTEANFQSEWDAFSTPEEGEDSNCIKACVVSYLDSIRNEHP